MLGGGGEEGGDGKSVILTGKPAGEAKVRCSSKEGVGHIVGERVLVFGECSKYMYIGGTHQLLLLSLSLSLSLSSCVLFSGGQQLDEVLTRFSDHHPLDKSCFPIFKWYTEAIGFQHRM